MINILISIISIVFISAFLGFLWTGIVSILILGFCKLTHREEPNISVEALDYIIVSNIILISVILCFICFNAESKNTDLNYLEDITNLKEENGLLNDKLDNANSKLENLEKEYQDSQDLISILTEQLEENGIEPNEL